MELNDANKNVNPKARPYMGNLTSEQIGSMAKAGELGGTMVKKMIEKQERELINTYNPNANSNQVIPTNTHNQFK